MWNLKEPHTPLHSYNSNYNNKTQTNKQIQTLRKREQICGYQRQGGGVGELDVCSQGYRLLVSCEKKKKPRVVMYNMMTVPDSRMVYLKVVKKVDLKSSYHKKKYIYIWYLYDMIDTKLIVIIVSQYVSQVIMWYTLNLHSVVC